MYITERGIIVPEKEWERTSVPMHSSTGLNFGEDSDETLYKYIDKTGAIGHVADLTVALPVRVDQVTHAAHQIYRWEHRWDQADQKEVLWNVEKAAPKIAELVFNDVIVLGTGSNTHTGQRPNYMGMVWLYNIESGLNVIVQVKKKEQRDHAFKITILTVLRRRGMSWKRMSEMAKITISETEARIVFVPTKTRA